LNQETHQTDIISFLPLELVHIVLQYLDVLELFSLRRVGLIWRYARRPPGNTITNMSFRSPDVGYTDWRLTMYVGLFYVGIFPTRQCSSIAAI